MAYPDFKAANAEVLGISPDSQSTLERYAREKATPFQFVSDSQRAIATSYGTLKGKRQSRVTYIIARGGAIAQSVHHELLVPKHISDSLSQVKQLGSS